VVWIDTKLRAGDLGAMVEQHGRLYRVEYQLNERFEAYVAAGVGAAAIGPADPPARFWLVRERDELMGTQRLPEAAPWGVPVTEVRYDLAGPLLARSVGQASATIRNKNPPSHRI